MKPMLIATLASLVAAAVDVSDFDWSVVEPSTSLNYTSCYDGHKCAKLLVPLDWLNPETNHAQVTLAVVARPAVVAESDASFGGSIMTNPGGPSGSGVGFLLNWGERLQRQADSDERKFEIVSFDPRGVGLTEPNADCYQSEFARGAFVLEDRAMGTPDAGIDVVRRKMSRAGAFGRLCETGDETNNIRGFMSTSSVARDMVALVDKLDELRKEDGSEREERLELRSSQSRDETPRLQYWGFSYGTVLGNYFASMFPGRVGRIILEAVEDPYDYVNATWALNLVDTQKALDHFWETCFEGGSSCALFKSTDNSSADVRGRFEAFLGSLDDSPAPYISSKTVVSITRQDVLGTIFSALYKPLLAFPSLATTIDEAMHGNFTALYEGMMLPTIANSCDLREPEAYTWSRDAQSAIACGDGEPQTNMTADDFVKYIDGLKADSPDFGPQWSHIRLPCKGWRIRPAYRFTGPWTTPASDPSLVKGKPAAPILFVSSLIDPVTPLANAREASKAHPGSIVLVQDNVGHGASITPGKCREGLIKKYFATGELPGEETHCKADCRPFQDCASLGVTTMANDEGRLESLRRRAPLSIFG
ncbi:TAP-like protein-domain-containing protein [Thelonectria olida]|uniref:TAP-like protein-domain-containing protein n=1 Tax=Thelonectria olida TaxID=1576542 RepID=A0A9P8VYU3_9HYPO|nr:TAP-like protein-domain-containing protein [Thelonectria olida]